MNLRETEVLLVEDNPSDLELALHALERGHLANRVEVARDGAEALDLLFCRGAHADRGEAELPKVVLLDVKLPLVDGIEVLREIKANARTKHIPVVMLTSSAEDHDLAACYAHGANSYIVKPVDIDQFFRAVQQLGMYWLLLNCPGAR
jgi:two-component system response regulator